MGRLDSSQTPNGCSVNISKDSTVCGMSEESMRKQETMLTETTQTVQKQSRAKKQEAKSSQERRCTVCSCS